MTTTEQTTPVTRRSERVRENAEKKVTELGNYYPDNFSPATLEQLARNEEEVCNERAAAKSITLRQNLFGKFIGMNNGNASTSNGPPKAHMVEIIHPSLSSVRNFKTTSVLHRAKAEYDELRISLSYSGRGK